MFLKNCAFAFSSQREAVCCPARTTVFEVRFEHVSVLALSVLSSVVTNRALALTLRFLIHKTEIMLWILLGCGGRVKINQECLLWYPTHFRPSIHSFPAFYLFSAMVGSRLVFVCAIKKQLRNHNSWCLWQFFVNPDYLLCDTTVKLFSMCVILVFSTRWQVPQGLL